jgi:hypothetical protein
MEFSDKQIEALIEGIYSGEITEYNIPDRLYFAIADHLKSALYKGFGGVPSDFVGTDFALLEELRTNIYMFSAAKSYTELKDMTGLLMDGDKVRSFSDFNKVCKKTFDVYNVDYLQSEYNTALASGDMAVKWDSIQRDKAILPVLRYQTTGGDVCDICKPLDNTTLPADDKFWKTRYPPNHFNCYCLVTSHESDEYPITKDIPQMSPVQQDIFKMNVGIDKYVFSPEHPYFDVAPKDKEYAKNNFDLPIPKTDSPLSEPKQVSFKPAKTLKEAEKRITENGVKSVSLKGMKEGQYNAVLQAVEDEFNVAGLNLQAIETYNSKRDIARAKYNPNNNSIYINLAKINEYKYKKTPTNEELKRDIEIQISNLKDNFLGNRSYNQSAIIKALRTYNKILDEVNRNIENNVQLKVWAVSNTFEDSNISLNATVHHEIGHNRHFKSIGKEKFKNYEKAKSITEYGETDHYEYFAEWYAQYRMYGEKGVPTEVLTAIKNLDNGNTTM